MMKQFANSQTCSEHLLLRTCNHLTELALFTSSFSHLTYLHLTALPVTSDNHPIFSTPGHLCAT